MTYIAPFCEKLPRLVTMLSRTVTDPRMMILILHPLELLENLFPA